jgi:hypothetical protein
MNVRIPAPAVKEYAPKTYFCKRAALPFTLDGNLNKPFWENAPWTDPFVDIEGDLRPAPRFLTRAKMLWDDENLYIGAYLEGDEIWANVTQRDDVIFRDNDFEIFIDPDSDTQRYVEFEMNARNVIWDLLLTKAYRDDGCPIHSFDIKDLRSAVHIDGALNDPSAPNKSWSCEVVIPFRSLLETVSQDAKTPSPGDFYRINFSRVQWNTYVKDSRYEKCCDPETGNPLPEDNWVWSPIGLINMHYPELWGYLFFTEDGENYTIPADEYKKWELRKLYYAQHANFDRTGSFDSTLTASIGEETIQVETTSNTFELSCSAADGGKLILFSDGKTVKKEGEEK